MGVPAALVIGYLLGSVDAAVIVARLKGVDIYEVGSGNPGASNVARALGKRWGAAVLVADLLKGLAAAAIGVTLGGSEEAGFAAGALAVVGHCFPVFHGFRGGKGVATTAGMMAWLVPWVFAISAVVWVVVTRITRVSAAGSLTAIPLGFVLTFFADVSGWSLLIMGAVAVLVVARHHENIGRLLAGRERRFD